MAIVRVMGEKMYSIGLGLIGSGSVLSSIRKIIQASLQEMESHDEPLKNKLERSLTE